MLDYKELRCGNLIEIDGEIITVEDGIISFCQSYPEKCHPIAITPEILEKCGFVKDTESQYGGWLIRISVNENIRIIDHNITGYTWYVYSNTPVRVPSLHSLMNLYFALTGLELKILNAQ